MINNYKVNKKEIKLFKKKKKTKINVQKLMTEVGQRK